MIPLTLYLFMILNELIVGYRTTLDYFYVEWVFTTPMILINLGRLLQIPFSHYSVIIAFDMTMVLSGYISYISTNPVVIFTAIGYGCACFCGIFTYYLRKLKVFNKKIREHSLPPISIYRDSIRYRIYRAIIITIICSWILYPLGHILYKLGITDYNQTVIIYVCLDIATKGIFTNMIIGLKEVYRIPSSYLGLLTKKLFQVHPLEIKPAHHKLDEILGIKKEVNVDTIVPSDDKSSNASNISNIIQINTEKSIDRELEEAIGLPTFFVPSRKVSIYGSDLDSIAENGLDSSNVSQEYKTGLRIEEL